MYSQPFLRVWSNRAAASIRPSSHSRYKLVSALSRHRLSTSSRSGTAFPVTPTDDSITTTSTPRVVADAPRDPKPFAIEHAGGREQYLSWSPDGQILKRWRDANTAVGSEGSRSGISIPVVSGAVGKMKSWLTTMFLPTNYPQSVHRSYKAYHILQFAETVFGTLVSVLCNQALLTAVGVSAEGSIFGAIAVQWIIKDGAGEIAKLFFIRRFSPFFDSHPKTFSLLGEAAVALGSGLQIATVLVNPTATNFLLCAAGGNIFKLIGQAIWLTTHVKFVRYFSQQGNTGDVAAKDESQASVAQLLGYAAGIGLLSLSHSPAYLYSIYFLAVPLHLFVTTWMLQLTTFELLTLPRLSWLSYHYARLGDGTSQKEVVNLAEVEKLGVTGLFGEFFKNKQDKFISLAPRLEEALSSSSEGHATWNLCADVFKNENYLLYPSTSHSQPRVSVFYDPSVTNDDMLRSILHAARLRELLTNTPQESDSPNFRLLLEESTEWTKQTFPDFKAQLEAKEWRMDEVCFADHGRRVSWKTSITKTD